MAFLHPYLVRISLQDNDPIMPTRVKICGLSTPETVEAALAGGAAMVGFMFFARSPRNLNAEAAARLAEPARGRAAVVAVMVDPENAELDAMARVLQPDFIQLHGKETPARAVEIKARTNARLIKVIAVAEEADLAAAKPYESMADHLMFDAKTPPGSALPGGMGASFDWTMMAGRRFARPWFLAGGLDPWNVRGAAIASSAPMVDVSSGVERGPGLKDPALIAAFLAAAHQA
jgi:phosphoribosylanthranilate isomerase